MMNGITNPAAIITALAKIEREGWTADLQHEIRRAVTNRDDMQRYPGHKMAVDRFAKLAYSLLGGLPGGGWHEAACEALLPDTYRGIVLEIIDQYEQRADEAAIASRSANKLARERGRA